MKQFMFDDKDAFLAKLQELLKSGVRADQIEIVTPIPVHEAQHLLQLPASPLRNFTFPAALTGTIAGMVLTLGTVWSWPLITSGKSLYSPVPFLIISFELTILFGAVASFLGFLHLNRLPDIKELIHPRETGNQYAIFVKEQA
jgi:molybdopterin-containing oxidoreductase family membrane subunit